MCELVEFILIHNYFRYISCTSASTSHSASNNKSTSTSTTKYYHQIHGTAMGSPLAPCYANIFLYQLEQQWLSKPLCKQHILFYKRYLDDIFGIIWATHSEAQSILSSFNQLHKHIQVTFDLSLTKVHFLDFHIFKGDRYQHQGILDMSVYSKAMNRFLYIPFSSYHSRAMKLAFIKAELIRFVRNSSSESSYEETCKSFYYRLRRRGYPDRFIVSAFKQVEYKNRQQYLKVSNNQQQQKQPTLNSNNKQQNNKTINNNMSTLKLLRHPLYQSISWRQLLNNNNNDNNETHQLAINNNDILPQTRVVWQLPPSFRKSLVRANSSIIQSASSTANNKRKDM